MLPAEPPLSLHLLSPVPPARTAETATATRQTAPATAPAPLSNATMARSVHTRALVGAALLAGHDQSGNAAVVTAALRTMPGAAPPRVIVPMT